MGLLESEWKVASNLTYLRRQVSVCGVRAVADSLLNRLQQAGFARGAAQAAKRRAEALGREERGRRELIYFIRRKILTLISPMEMPNRIPQSRKRLMLGIPPNSKTILQKS